MKPIFAFRRLRLAAAILCAVGLACAGQTSDSESLEWQPSRPASVRGVESDLIRTAIDSLLRAEPFEPIDADTWRHVRGLYRNEDGGPFWMTSRGVDRRRARALGGALVGSVDDALDPDKLPLEAATQA